MKTINFLVAVFCILIISLIGLSFVYFEKSEHKNYYYIVRNNNKDIGQESVDLYETQETLIFKSKNEYPFRSGYELENIKLTLARTFVMRDFEIERTNGESKRSYYLRNMPKGLTFISLERSKFACLNNMSISESALPFNRYDVVTYYPFVQAYNYTVGGAQSFKALCYFDGLLPPYRGIISLTSIREEYIYAGGKRVKSECLIMKEKGRHDAYLWVAKDDKRILLIKNDEDKIEIRLSNEKLRYVARPYKSLAGTVIERRMSVKLKEGAAVCIVTRPIKKSICPGIILVAGEDYFSDYYGFFEDLAAYLAEQGYAVISYLGGIKGSGAKYEAMSVSDDLMVLDSILKYFKRHPSSMNSGIGVIGLADANFILPAFIKKNDAVKAWVMISPARLVPIKDIDTRAAIKELEYVKNVDPKYEKDLLNMFDRTMDVVEVAAQDRKRVLGVEVFLKRMKEISLLNPIEDINAISKPILLLQGAMDKTHSSDFSKRLDAVMSEPGLDNRLMVYFRNLDAMTGGNMVSEEIVKDHVRTNKDVFRTITEWIGKNI